MTGNTQASDNEDLITNLIGYAIVGSGLILIGVLLLFLISIPVAFKMDYVGVEEFGLVDGQLDSVYRGQYVDEDFLFGFPAMANALLGEQPEKIHKTRDGQFVDLSEIEEMNVVVVNGTPKTLYNEPVTYGETQLRDDVKLHFSVEPKTYKIVKYFVAQSVSCASEPPQTSTYSYINWTTLGPASDC